MTPAEHQQFIAEGVKLTRFSYPLLGASPSQVQDAVATIREHHPGQTIWVQHAQEP
jgi:hypothetical protein